MNTPLDSPTLRLKIQSTLSTLTSIGDPHPGNAVELLLATCAQESNFGIYRTQTGGGPARGIFQMEGEDHDDIWTNYVRFHPLLQTSLIALSNTHQTDDMVNNDPYAIAMCRVHYERCKGYLPQSSNLMAIWMYYKANYNTAQGAATQSEFFHNYKQYVTDGKAI